MMNLIQISIPFETALMICEKNRSETKNYKVCLEYHIGNCLGGCVGEQSESDYDHQISQILCPIYCGNFSEAIKGFKKDEASPLMLDYEEAQKQKNKIDILNQLSIQICCGQCNYQQCRCVFGHQ